MRTLFLAVSALSLCALAACGRQETSTDSPAAEAAAPQQPVDTPAPPPRSVTQASAVAPGDSGAYGMPRAPVPYNALGAYERQWDQQAGEAPPSALQPAQPGQAGQPGQPPSSPRAHMAKPRTADTVFY